MVSLSSTQFNPASFITKVLKPKKVIFFSNINHVSTINGYYPEPIHPPEYEHLLSNMWDTAPDSPVTVLPHDINIYGEDSATHDPFSSPHIIPPPSLYAQFTDLSSPYQDPTTHQNPISAEPSPLRLSSRRSCKSQTFKRRAGRAHSFQGKISNLVTYLHPEGKGKEKMMEEETKTDQRSKREERKWTAI